MFTFLYTSAAGTHFAGGSGCALWHPVRSLSLLVEDPGLDPAAPVLAMFVGRILKNATTWFLSPGHFIKHQSRYSSEGILKMELKVWSECSHTPSHCHTSPNSYTETPLNIDDIKRWGLWRIAEIVLGPWCEESPCWWDCLPLEERGRNTRVSSVMCEI